MKVQLLCQAFVRHLRPGKCQVVCAVVGQCFLSVLWALLGGFIPLQIFEICECMSACENMSLDLFISPRSYEGLLIVPRAFFLEYSTQSPLS